MNEWYDPAGRDLGLKRILLADAGAERSFRRMRLLLLSFLVATTFLSLGFGSSASVPDLSSMAFG